MLDFNDIDRIISIAEKRNQSPSLVSLDRSNTNKYIAKARDPTKITSNSAKNEYNIIERSELTRVSITSFSFSIYLIA
jgi:hypothetical protein